eukprot:g12758.t1
MFRMTRRVRCFSRSLQGAALAFFGLWPYPSGASGSSGTAGVGAAAEATGTVGGAVCYEAPFKSPWNPIRNGGLQHLEHVNVCIPAHDPAKNFYYDILGFVPDTRRAHNIGKGSGTIWANMGTTQIHLPEGEPQVVPGTIGLVYDPPDLAEVVSRLRSAAGKAGVGGGDSDFPLEGTKFALREPGDGEAGGEDSVEVVCPYGNVYRLHKRNGDQRGDFDPRGGRLPAVAFAERPSSPSARGLGGVAYVSFRVKPGTAGGIAGFYREVFGAEVEEIGGGSGGDGGCAAEEGGGSREMSCSATTGAVVRVGPVQHLAFVEGEEALPEEYDGHHICVYLTEEGFYRSYLEAERRGLVFVNPRRNFGKADTLEKALEEKQFRIKNMVDPATGELLHELEHEIRSISHPSYPAGKDLSALTPM